VKPDCSLLSSSSLLQKHVDWFNTGFSAADFIERVFSLGPDCSFYGEALDDKMTVDSAFLQNSSDWDVEILFAFAPRAHQVQLESLLPQNSNASQPAEKPLLACLGWRPTPTMNTNSLQKKSPHRLSK
jgi:hypothetical protein